MAEEKICKVCNLVSGLLASGHYTNQDDEYRGGDPYVRSWDAGKDWENEGHLRRFPSHVVADAINLLGEIETAIGMEFDSIQSDEIQA